MTDKQRGAIARLTEVVRQHGPVDAVPHDVLRHMLRPLDEPPSGDARIFDAAEMRALNHARADELMRGLPSIAETIADDRQLGRGVAGQSEGEVFHLLGQLSFYWPRAIRRRFVSCFDTRWFDLRNGRFDSTALQENGQSFNGVVDTVLVGVQLLELEVAPRLSAWLTDSLRRRSDDAARVLMHWVCSLDVDDWEDGIVVRNARLTRPLERDRVRPHRPILHWMRHAAWDRLLGQNVLQGHSASEDTQLQADFAARLRRLGLVETLG